MSVLPRLHLGAAWLLCIVLLSVLGCAQARLPVMVDEQPVPSLAPMLERTIPGVVNLATRGRVVEQSPLFDDPFFRRFFDVPQLQRERRTQGLGSGVILDAARGYILTNHHVIHRADEIIVTLHDGRRFDATVVGSDADTDLAVIQIQASDLVALRAADSDHLRVGDFVVAIGNPFGLGQTVTSGIVSALGRSGLGVETYEDFIQTDASINPGNSGGALVNLRGELVGINTAILARGGGNIGIGFAIPINMAREVMTHLVEYGEVQRGRLGIAVQDLTHDLAQAFGLSGREGAVITRVETGSPAAQAGLREGDVIVRINGRVVRHATDVRNVIGLLRIDSTVRLDILRNGQPLNLHANVARRAGQQLDAASLDARLQGAMLADLDDDSPLYGQVSGVVIKSVARNSRAARAGLREGDVILSVNRQAVQDLAHIQRLLASPTRNLLLNIRREQQAFFLLLQ
ncbi:DegQ family serine endoprotease [Thiorhodospira sibirica]|uniref:DegQ family serine endoprotease n=1 Tax=Thiorhodospira sibirica TaxID=154347 RepID=UPI00022C4C7F|nr:DegQ family serine endoprotease [Thiorhodospira sibirica]